MSRIRSLSASIFCESARTSSASLAISPRPDSTATSPSAEARSPWRARPITVSAVSAALVAVWPSCPIVAVVSRTEAAVSAVIDENEETVERSDWAATKSSCAVLR